MLYPWLRAPLRALLRALLRRLSLAVLLFAAAASAGAQEAKLVPVDEAGDDLSWARFKSSLLDAVERRDLKFLMGVLDPAVRSGGDGKPGIASFRKHWDLDAKDSVLWVELPRILFLGGRYVKGPRGRREFCAPYVAYAWPLQIDRFDYGAVVSATVLVQAAPTLLGRSLTTLSHDIVKVSDWDVADADPVSKQRWVAVQVKEGTGYVPEEQIRSAVEHRACFTRGPSGWRIVFVGAGE